MSSTAQEIISQLSKDKQALSELLFDLGLFYSTGELCPPDYVVAHSWFNLAAMQGNELARECRSALARDLTAEEIARAQKLAREWARVA